VNREHPRAPSPKRPPVPVVRSLAGAASVVVIAAVVALSAVLFAGGFTRSVPVTVLAARAGLVMNPDAKVEIRGVQVGKVASIEELPDGQAALHLGIDPAHVTAIPANVDVEIASTTVFGAKYVQLVLPADPSPASVHAGQVFSARHVTVEVNTVFQRLTKLLDAIDPMKLNEALGAISSAMGGRGAEMGRTISDLDAALARLQPSLPTMAHDLATAPAVLGAFADAAPDLVHVADNATQLSRTVVEEQRNLDALLISAIGLGDVGGSVVADNHTSLATMLHTLLPTSDLLHSYHDVLYCGIAGMLPLAMGPPPPDPGVSILVGLFWGKERYRYPGNLPKVAAKGGPQCLGMPKVPYEQIPPFLVTDTGAFPWPYGNTTVKWNYDLSKEILYGPLDGPPRNTAQVGQPG
jgi:phospholipid/cholesterol/gamma-HCH transport system substrate-binding protein